MRDPELDRELLKHNMRLDLIPASQPQKPNRTRDKKDEGRTTEIVVPTHQQQSEDSMNTTQTNGSVSAPSAPAPAFTPETMAQAAKNAQEIRDLLKKQQSLPRKAIEIGVTAAATVALGSAVYFTVKAFSAPAAVQPVK